MDETRLERLKLEYSSARSGWASFDGINDYSERVDWIKLLGHAFKRGWPYTGIVLSSNGGAEEVIALAKREGLPKLRIFGFFCNKGEEVRTARVRLEHCFNKLFSLLYAILFFLPARRNQNLGWRDRNRRNRFYQSSLYRDLGFLVLVSVVGSWTDSISGSLRRILGFLTPLFVELWYRKNVGPVSSKAFFIEKREIAANFMLEWSGSILYIEKQREASNPYLLYYIGENGN